VFYWFLWLNMRITDRLDWIRAITGDKRLSSSTVRVGNYLAWAHNHSRGQLNPSIATIQENANVSRRAALYAIKSLVDAGYLEKRGGPKRGTRSDYILLLPSCPASTSADSAPVEAQTRAKIDTAPGADIAPLSGEGGCKNRHEPVQKSTRTRAKIDIPPHTPPIRRTQEGTQEDILSSSPKRELDPCHLGANAPAKSPPPPGRKGTAPNAGGGAPDTGVAPTSRAISIPGQGGGVACGQNDAPASANTPSPGRDLFSDLEPVGVADGLPDDTTPSAKKHEQKQHALIAKSVIDHLNAKTGKRFRHTKTNLRLVTARLKDGYTEQDMIDVIDARVALWLFDETMYEYLRPSTLFRPSNFDEYLAAAKAAPPPRAGAKKKSIPDITELVL